MIEFAGVQLLKEDPEGKLQSWLNRTIPVDTISYCLPTVSLREGRTRNRGSELYKVGLPTPQWTWPKEFRLNTLWLPTGASRWAIGLFLASSEQLKQITDNLDETGSANLDFGHSDGYDRIRMSLLPARKAAVDLWIVPLVDERYWWQYRDMGNYEITEDTGWDELIDHTAERLGISERMFHGLVPEAYVEPDQLELLREHENAAVVMDAIGFCLGCRFVPNFRIQEYFLSSASLAEDIVDKRVAEIPVGPNDSIVLDQRTPIGRTHFPEQIKVVFPKTIEGYRDESGDTYFVTVNTTNYRPFHSNGELVPAVAGTVKTFYDTAEAKFTASGQGPLNSADLELLANRITFDYIEYSKYVYDYCTDIFDYLAVCGYDDYLWFHIGYQFPRPDREHTPKTDLTRLEKDWDKATQAIEPQRIMGEYACFVRIVSQAPGFGVSELLHQFRDEFSSSSSSSSSESSSSSSSSNSSSSSSSESSLSSQSSSSSSSSESSSSSISTSGSSSSSSSSTSSASSSSSVSTSGSSSSSSSLSSISTSGSSSPSSSVDSTESSGIKRIVVYVPTATGANATITLKKHNVWVDPLSLEIMSELVEPDDQVELPVIISGTLTGDLDAGDDTFSFINIVDGENVTPVQVWGKTIISGKYVPGASWAIFGFDTVTQKYQILNSNVCALDA